MPVTKFALFVIVDREKILWGVFDSKVEAEDIVNTCFLSPVSFEIWEMWKVS